MKKVSLELEVLSSK